MALTKSNTRSLQASSSKLTSKQDSKRAVRSGKKIRLKPLQKRTKLPPQLERLAEGIGSFIQYWGFKTIHGKIWTLLYLSKDPLSPIEISRKLRVSKTLLSFSIADLLEYDVIQEAGKGAKRTVYFRANPNLTAVILNVLRKREAPLMEEIDSSYQQLDQMEKNSGQMTQQTDADFSLDRERMKKMGEFISSAREALQSLIVHTDPDSELIGQFLLIAAVLARGAKG